VFIFRKTAKELITMNSTAATCTVHQIEEFAWGLIAMPAALNGANVNFWVCDTEDGTYTELYINGAAKSVAVAVSSAIPIPSEAMAANWLKVLSDNGVSDVGNIYLKT